MKLYSCSVYYLQVLMPTENLKCSEKFLLARSVADPASGADCTVQLLCLKCKLHCRPSPIIYISYIMKWQIVTIE